MATSGNKLWLLQLFLDTEGTSSDLLYVVAPDTETAMQKAFRVVPVQFAGIDAREHAKLVWHVEAPDAFYSIREAEKEDILTHFLSDKAASRMTIEDQRWLFKNVHLTIHEV